MPSSLSLSHCNGSTTRIVFFRPGGKDVLMGFHMCLHVQTCLGTSARSSCPGTTARSMSHLPTRTTRRALGAASMRRCGTWVSHAESCTLC